MSSYSLYSDGNSFPRAKKSGFGGYIEDSNGQILIEYTEQVREAQYFHNFELLGIIRGLQLAKSMDIKNITSYCDDKTTALRLKKIFTTPDLDISFIPEHAKPELFKQIISLSREFQDIKFEYIPRSQNKHSDSLSRRYAALMEQNFLKQYQDDLNRAQEMLQQGIKPTKRIFFSHPNMVRNEHKINPFLVAQYRNKKVRKNSRQELLDNYQFLFLEVVPAISPNLTDNYTYKAFRYNENKEKELIASRTMNETQFHQIDNFCQFMTDAFNEIAKKGNKVWFFSNSKSINQYFEQKEKLPMKDWDSFTRVYQALNQFEKTYYHNLPFEHEFSPEIALQEKKKANLSESVENLDNLMDQLQNGVLRDKKKYFGLLIRHQLRDYRNLLARELNDIEKNDVIQKTTESLTAQGMVDLPNIKNITTFKK